MIATEIKLAKTIYSKKEIETAISDYSHLCVVGIGENSRYWIVTFFEFTGDFRILKKEFENYLIELMNGAQK